MGRQAPQGLAGIHMNLLVTTLGGAMPPTDTVSGGAALPEGFTIAQNQQCTTGRLTLPVLAIGGAEGNR